MHKMMQLNLKQRKRKSMVTRLTWVGLGFFGLFFGFCFFLVPGN